MNELEKKSLIEKKKEQIKLLEQEILELKQPTSIATYVHKNMLAVHKERETGEYEVRERQNFGGPEWDYIRKLGIELVKEKYDLRYNQKLPVKSLSSEDVHICAEMAEELIEVWNKNVKKVYGGTK